MELKLRDGDYVADGLGGLARVDGAQAALHRALFRLTARRGMFPILPDFGSRLWQLGSIPSAKRQSAAMQYVTEALAEESELQVSGVTLSPRSGGALALTVELAWEGQALSVELTVR
jgi:hypothetical protein